MTSQNDRGSSQGAGGGNVSGGGCEQDGSLGTASPPSALGCPSNRTDGTGEPSKAAPTDADFDDMHHALGRPVFASEDTYRNYYCCEAGSPLARRFEALGLWDFRTTINAGTSAIYHVNEAGRLALADWLEAQRRKRGVRPYRVSGPGLTPRTIVAKSPSAAKYSVYLDVSDIYAFDDGFMGFLRTGVRVVIA